jgi:5-methylcytosine-specific restriction endonuclease McrA
MKKERTKEERERKRDLDEFKEKMRRRKRESFPYAEQLKDKRWLDFRKKVFRKRGRKCEVCGCKSHLQVHHVKYRWPKLAWEYDIKDMRVLCPRCHAEAHGKPFDYVAAMYGLK